MRKSAIVFHVNMKKVKRVADRLDRAEYPETAEVLDAILDGSVRLPDDLGEVADELMYECDLPKIFPYDLRDLVKDMYFDAMKCEVNEDAGASANNLGAHYYNGARGFEKNCKTGILWYIKGARLGSSVARENLGYCYYYGNGVEQDYEKAFKWFSIGAFLGEPVSTYKIGDMYRNGYHVDMDKNTAFLIYKRCLLLMSDEDRQDAAGPVYLRLGDMYFSGSGTPADAREALECYRLAQCYLEEMVENGQESYRSSLDRAMEGQIKAQEALLQAPVKEQRP